MYSSLTLELAQAVMAARTTDAASSSRSTRHFVARRRRQRAEAAYRIRLHQLATS